MNKKVLVVEDNPDNLLLISYVLERSGYTVLSAETGEEGVKMALGEGPCFIIMDIQLPGIDGYETTRQIRSSPEGKTIPIIAMTSFAMRGDQQKALEVGCTGYFEKPIDPITVMDQIHQILAKESS